MEPFCLSELESGDETVEPLKLLALQLLSCPSIMLNSVLILLTWPIIAWHPAKFRLPSLWEVTLAL